MGEHVSGEPGASRTPRTATTATTATTAPPTAAACASPRCPARPPPTPSSVYSQQQHGHIQHHGHHGRAAVPRYADPHHNPSREIRMVYHKPNGDSRVSIFARGGTRGHAYYNPITHQANDFSQAAGSKYHSRNQPMLSNGYPAPRSLAQQYTAQRRRVTPSHWY